MYAEKNILKIITSHYSRLIDMKTITFICLILNLSFNAQQRLTTHPSLKNKLGTHFPIERYQNEKGEKFTSKELNGKMTFVNFWSTNCEPCIEEHPYLNALKEKLGEKVNFIAITHDTKEKVDIFLTKKEFKFFHITDSIEELKAYFQLIRNPITFILDKEGNIIEITGTIDEYKNDTIVEILTT